MGLILPTPSPSPPQSTVFEPTNVGLGISPGILFCLAFCYLFFLLFVPIGWYISTRREKRRYTLEGPLFPKTAKWGSSSSTPEIQVPLGIAIDGREKEFKKRFGYSRPIVTKKDRWAELKEVREMSGGVDEGYPLLRRSAAPVEFGDIPLHSMTSTSSATRSNIPAQKKPAQKKVNKRRAWTIAGGEDGSVQSPPVFYANGAFTVDGI